MLFSQFIESQYNKKSRRADEATLNGQVVELKNSMEENVSDVKTTSLLNVKTKRNLNN